MGSKAWNLGLLCRAGLPVPPGFAVSAAALQLHLDDNNLRATVDDQNSPSDMAAAIIAAPMPAAVVDALLALRRSLPGTLIVRSSGVGEDGDDASFAGQLDSFSGIDADDAALLLAVKRVWASGWSARALFYQRARGRPLRGVGVVVQRFVDARVAGVLFTQAPDDPSKARAEFVMGAGEELVSGRVTPGVLEGVHGKARVVSWPEQAAERVPFDAQHVVDVGAQIERLFGRAQDIEWCVDDDGAFFVVQARPITVSGTVTGALKRPARFSNANVNENFPTPVSPLLYSIARKGYAAYFENLGRLLGVDDERIEAVAPALSSLVGAHGARLYYNLSSLHGCLRAAPFGEWLTSSFNVFVGVDGGAAEGSRLLPWARTDVVKETRAALRLITRGSFALATASRRLPAFERAVDVFADASHPTLLPWLDDDDLAGLVRQFLDVRVNRWGPAALSDVSAMVGYGVLRSVLQRLVPDAEATLQNDLLKGLADVVSGIPTQRLWELAQKRRAGDVRFDVELAWFLEEWGFRRSGELLLTVPTFQEDPAPILALIDQLAGSEGASPVDVTRAQAAERERRTAAFLSPLPLPLRPLLQGLLRFTREAIGLRERARSKQALLYTRLRHVVLEVGARLQRRSELERVDDVFLLTIDELLDHLAGVALFGSLLRETCVTRREQHARLTQSTPPDSFVIEKGSYRTPSSSSSSSSSSSDLTGTAASSGQASGRAAVLRDVQEAARMTRGDILVTKQTDPGWGPVLFLASALVIERGGMLSHGAIIAREFGVPCVVGVVDASTRIAHGARLHVDGDHGVVTVLPAVLVDEAPFFVPPPVTAREVHA
ncbi:MAG: PEP/pyruvate-binding domain-containing protein [Deltaproteobacteria bacterium]|nr:PEP/pyruvate-binding domain-containing protein [Deltaproteobacteria bacterium]